jgi:hypothetical protein
MKRYWPFIAGVLMLCLQFYATIIGSGNVFYVNRSPVSIVGTVSESRDQLKAIEELTYKARVNAAICDWFIYGSYLSIVMWVSLGWVLIRQQKDRSGKGY